jgi:hypothetical protein
MFLAPRDVLIGCRAPLTMTEVADAYSIYRIADKISHEGRIRSKGLGFWSDLRDIGLSPFELWGLGDSWKGLTYLAK